MYHFALAADQVKDLTATTNDPLSLAVDKSPKESVEENPNLDAKEISSTMKGMNTMYNYEFYITKVIFIELFQGLTLSKKLQICFGNIGTILDRLLYLAIFHTRHIL